MPPKAKRSSAKEASANLGFDAVHLLAGKISCPA